MKSSTGSVRVADFDRSVTSALERNETGQGVADRRGGREIAGESAEIADLARADPPHQSGESREMLVERGQRFRISDGAADFQRAVGA